MERLAKLIPRLQYRITSYLMALHKEGRLGARDLDEILDLLSRGPTMEAQAFHEAMARVLARVQAGPGGQGASGDAGGDPGPAAPS